MMEYPGNYILDMLKADVENEVAKKMRMSAITTGECILQGIADGIQQNKGDDKHENSSR